MRLVQSLDRGLEIMELLAKSSEPVTVTAVGGALGVDKSTAYRLLATLQERGYVEQDRHRRYQLGFKTIQLGMAELNRQELRQRARPYLEQLVQETGETAHLARWVQRRVIYIDRVESPNPVSVSTHVGEEVPAHCTATGKALIAFLREDELESYLKEADLKRFTARTITDVDSLRRHLALTRARGYAIDDEELHVGVRCVAAPILGFDGFGIGSVGISGPAHRLTLEFLEDLHPIVARIATELSVANGFQPVT